MFLHLLKEDSKFPPLVRSLFEAALPGENTYVVLCDGESAPQMGEGFHFVREPRELGQLLKKLDRLDCVIMHGVLGRAYPYLRSLPREVILAWVVWGVEVYEHLRGDGMKIYGPLTSRYFQRTPVARLKNLIRPYYSKLRGHPQQTAEVLQRLSHVVTQLPAEFNLLRDRNSIPPSCGHLEVPVVFLEDLVDAQKGCRCREGENIQVGNSAHPSNNHLEAFQILQRHDLAGRKVLVPLSYGDPQYRNFILARGKEMLGDAFQPVTDFLPLKEYLALLGSCPVVMMNQYRQQALGNIIAALWDGARVYLGPSATYTDYREWGLSVFALDESFCLSAISPDEISENAVRNRRILQERLGREVVLPRLRSWLENLKKEGA